MSGDVHRYNKEVWRRREDKRILERRAKKVEKEKRRKEKRREKLAEDASEDKPADVEVTEFPGEKACKYCQGHQFPCRITVIAGMPSKRKAGPGPIWSACDVCKKRKSACPWPGVKKVPKKSKLAAGKKKIGNRILRLRAERLLEAEQTLSVRTATCVGWFRNFGMKFADPLRASGQEEEMSWMGDAMVESQRITEDFKEEAEKKKKCAGVDTLANTDGGSEKLDDVEDSLKVKEEKMDEGESGGGEEFRRARGHPPPESAEVIVITDSEDEEDLWEICAKCMAKGKGRAKHRVELDDEEVDSLKNSEDEENTDPDADAEEDVAGKQMSEPPIVTEDVPKSDD
ncbi:hypothetical protein B0H19DRAFT_1251536 [Mycena capillaripes]|nr:hypothetical protein B0H19DRAFT_1251536 [Mycena capillaripes]